MSVGKRIMTERKNKNLTIKDVAAMSGISTSMISQIENDKGNPSLNTLNALAHAIGVEVAVFFNSETDHFNNPVVRSSERPIMSKSNEFTTYQLSAGNINRFCVYYNVLVPGGSTTNFPEHHPATATGYEFGYILNGKLRVEIEDQVYILNPGDSICIDATKQHASTNIASVDCEMLWFMIP
jgi:transcriptional regulator with XRE-family HTH domain